VEGSGSFLKKRTKKLLFIRVSNQLVGRRRRDRLTTSNRAEKHQEQQTGRNRTGRKQVVWLRRARQSLLVENSL
jgi:hypothetical protein